MSDKQSIKFGFKPRSRNWTSLRLLNVFRVAVAAIFFSQSFILESPLLKIVNLSLYAWTSFGYLLVALVIFLASWIERRNFQLQVTIQTYIDIIAIILIMHACGGIGSGLGMLLIISIAVIGLLGKDSLATVFASLATVGLLAEYSYSVNSSIASGTSTQVGLLGAALFATALVTQHLTQRIRRSEELIQQQKLDVANLSAINAEILENMQSGVLALDNLDQVRHINDTAKSMLKPQFAEYKEGLRVPFDASEVLPEIYRALNDWRESPQSANRLISSGRGSSDIQAGFHELRSRSHQGTLVFLDDLSRIKHEMQQSKLAALGHLTANIAHEIRNPLGAISHAAQLLAENKELPATEIRLTEIIKQHSNRINHIIEDIMQISRGHVASKDTMQLQDWMSRFIESFCLGSDIDKECIQLEIDTQVSEIHFDAGHLNRILTNLCNNARSHGHSDLPLYIKIYQDENQSLCIEVADQGKGIDAEERDKIFEPFYTTSHKGSGLGLYIVSQLCELNDAEIVVTSNEYGGSSFIIRTLKLSGRGHIPHDTGGH
jgi:two-component system sensor histidine kinase PilS (NtrC family)